MSILSNISTVTVVALASLASNASMAAIEYGSGHSSINITSFELIDLDPNDGIAPAIIFGTNPGDSQNEISTHSITYGKNVSWDYDSNKIDTLDHNNVYSESKQGAAFGFGDAIHGLASKGYQYHAGDFLAQSNVDHVFTLSANTQLVVKGHISGGLYDNHYGDFSGGGNASYMLYAKAQNGGAEQVSKVAEYWATWNGASPERDFSLALSNNYNAVLNGELHAAAGISGYLTAAPDPIPEPETWAMMGTGLFGLAAVARLRRRKAQNS